MYMFKIVDKSFKPIIYLSILFSIATLVEFYNFFENTWLSLLDSVLDELSYNIYQSLANWFNIFVWVICGFSFVMLRNVSFDHHFLTKKNRNVLLIIGSLISFMALEKIFHFHLMFEFRAINLLGFLSPSMRKDSPYYWLFIIVIPLFLFILWNLVIAIYKLIKNIKPGSATRKKVILFLLLALISIPLNVLFDIIQGYYWYKGQRNTIYNGIEGIIENCGLCFFIGCNILIAKYYQIDKQSLVENK
jgi:hypothetical protein